MSAPRSDVKLAAVDDATEFEENRKPASHPHAVLFAHVQHLLLVATVLAKQLKSTYVTRVRISRDWNVKWQ